MAAVQEAVKKFAKPKKADRNLCSLDITLTNPIIMAPMSHLTDDKIVADLGMIRLTNRLDGDGFEIITIAMNDMNLRTDISNQVCLMCNIVFLNTFRSSLL